jgi:outer membrane protein OmpA-like peptidoglycan-associated protein
MRNGRVTPVGQIRLSQEQLTGRNHPKLDLEGSHDGRGRVALKLFVDRRLHTNTVIDVSDHLPQQSRFPWGIAGIAAGVVVIVAAVLLLLPGRGSPDLTDARVDDGAQTETERRSFEQTPPREATGPRETPDQDGTARESTSRESTEEAGDLPPTTSPGGTSQQAQEQADSEAGVDTPGSTAAPDQTDTDAGSRPGETTAGGPRTDSVTDARDRDSTDDASSTDSARTEPETTPSAAPEAVRSGQGAETEPPTTKPAETPAIQGDGADQEPVEQPAFGGPVDDVAPPQKDDPVIVYFLPDSSRILPEARARLQRLYGVLRDYPNYSLVIEGHCAIAGSEAGRAEISENRAGNVMSVLSALGWEFGRGSTVVGRGATDPVTADEELQYLNRRVEIWALPPSSDEG